MRCPTGWGSLSQVHSSHALTQTGDSVVEAREAAAIGFAVVRHGGKQLLAGLARRLLRNPHLTSTLPRPAENHKFTSFLGTFASWAQGLSVHLHRDSRIDRADRA